MIRLPNGLLTIARGPDGALVGVLDVLRGKDCGCVCPECGQPLIAKLGPERSPHFAHRAKSSHCTGMGAWHEAVRDEICGLARIDLGRSPLVPRLAGVQKVLRASRELTILDRQFRPDALLEIQAGATIAVEVVDTHEVPALNLAAMLQEQRLVLRIDVGMIRAALKSKSVRGDLPRLLSASGPWQSWPTFTNGAFQASLPLENRSRWSRWLRSIAGPPSGPLVARTPFSI